MWTAGVWMARVAPTTTIRDEPNRENTYGTSGDRNCPPPPLPPPLLRKDRSGSEGGRSRNGRSRGPRAAREQADVQHMAGRGRHADADEQPRPGGGGAP